MKAFLRLAAAAVLATSIIHGAQADSPPVPEQALRAVLEESKAKGRGVAVQVNGSTINLVVVSVDDAFVVGRSQQSSRIVVRIERIDAVSTLF